MPIQDVQLTNKQHAVPQNIMDVEFKLIGDLTMRQFFYVVIFGLMSWGSFVLIHSIFRWPAVIISALLGIGLAFVPLEDRGMDQWIINFFKSIYTPSQRIWKKNPIIPIAFTYQNLAIVKQELITLAPTSSRRKLEEYLEMHDNETEPDKLDMQEHKYIKMVKEAFVSGRVSTLELQPPQQSQTFIPLQPKKKQPEQAEVYVKPMTPDRHSGRVFTNLLPSQGEIILPIRGERILKTTEQITVDESVEEKSQQLKKLISQIKSDEQYKEVLKSTETEDSPQPAAQTPAKTKMDQNEQEAQEAKDILEKIRGENIRLSLELDRLKRQQEGAEKEEIKRLENAKNLTSDEFETLQNKIRELEIQMRARQEISGPRPTVRPGILTDRPPLPKEPNIISGVVKNNDENALEGVVILIKDSRGNPKRAIKTNSVGQFTSNAPLVNDVYKIEVDNANKTGLTFDILSVEAKGQIIQPLELKGRI